MTKTGNPAKDAGVMLKDVCHSQVCVMASLEFLSGRLMGASGMDESDISGLSGILDCLRTRLSSSIVATEEVVDMLEAHHG